MADEKCDFEYEGLGGAAETCGAPTPFFYAVPGGRVWRCNAHQDDAPAAFGIPYRKHADPEAGDPIPGMPEPPVSARGDDPRMLAAFTEVLRAARPWPEERAALASSPGGVKFDSEKVRADLLAPLAIEGLARVLTYGAAKYEAHNWRKGIEWSRVQAALLRHVLAFMRGEDIDPESGLPHIDHVMCNAMFLSEFSKTGTGTDDRYEA